MNTTHSPRRWYVLDQATDEYAAALEKGDGDFGMLKSLKVIKSILFIVAISAISLYALYLGADPTMVALISIPSLAGYAGVEIIDYAALAQAYREVKVEEKGD